VEVLKPQKTGNAQKDLHLRMVSVEVLKLQSQYAHQDLHLRMVSVEVLKLQSQHKHAYDDTYTYSMLEYGNQLQCVSLYQHPPNFFMGEK
jgi:hypothetical protein